MSRLSFRAPHCYVEANDEGGSLNLGVCPIPVFALSRVPYEQAIALRELIDQYIRGERRRRNLDREDSET